MSMKLNNPKVRHLEISLSTQKIEIIQVEMVSKMHEKDNWLVYWGVLSGKTLNCMKIITFPHENFTKEKKSTLRKGAIGRERNLSVNVDTVSIKTSSVVWCVRSTFQCTIVDNIAI